MVQHYALKSKASIHPVPVDNTVFRAPGLVAALDSLLTDHLMLQLLPYATRFDLAITPCSFIRHITVLILL